MCEAAWVAVFLAPLLAKKCRGSQAWWSGVYLQNHCRDKTNFQKHTKLDIENGNMRNGCHLIWQSHPLQMKVPSQNHLRRLQLSWCLPLLAWSWDGWQALEQPGRRKKHKTVWSIWLSTSPTNAVKHILLQPRWRTLMYCKFVNVCSAGCSLVFPAVEEILTYCDCRFQCDPGNSIHLRHSRHWRSRRTR